MYLSMLILRGWRGGGGGEGGAKAGDLNSKQFLGSNAQPQGHHNWSKEDKFPTPPTKTRSQRCFIERKNTNFLRKPHPFLSTIYCWNKVLRRNASIMKECFPPTQLNKFAAVKQANSLAFWARLITSRCSGNEPERMVEIEPTCFSNSGKTFLSCCHTG